MNRRELKRMTKEELSYNNNYWRMTLVIFIYLIVVFVGKVILDCFPMSTLLNLLYEVFVEFPLDAGIIYIALRIVRHENYRIEDLMMGFSYWMKVAGIAILYLIIVGIGFVIFVIPGIIAILKLSQSLNILTDNYEKGVIQCLKESSSLMRGHCWELFVLYWSFILWFILCVFTMGIGIIFLAPYIFTTLCNYYRYLKEEIYFDGSQPLDLEKETLI